MHQVFNFYYKRILDSVYFPLFDYIVYRLNSAFRADSTLNIRPDNPAKRVKNLMAFLFKFENHARKYHMDPGFKITRLSK